MRVIVTSQNVAGSAEDLYRAGVRTVGRGYGCGTRIRDAARIERTERDALFSVGLSVAALYDPGPLHDGASARTGRRDAQRALDRAAALDQPVGSAIYLCVTRDAVAAADLSGLRDHFAAAADLLGAAYRVGVCGSGHVARALLDTGCAELAWIGPATAPTGTNRFIRSMDWALLSGPEAVWPGNAFRYAPNRVNPAFPDFGQFGADGAGSGATPPAPLGDIMRVTARDGLNLRRGPGVEYPVARTLPHDAVVFAVGAAGDWIAVDTEGDGLCDGHMHAGYLDLMAGGHPGQAYPGATPYDIARLEMAESNRNGRSAAGNPRVFLYHASTDHGDKEVVPWCSSFVNYCVHMAGIIGTNSRRALSWHDQEWGTDVTQSPREGDIAVLGRTAHDAAGHAASGGHVAFYVSGTAETVTLLGANDVSRVSLQPYPRDGILSGHRFRLKSIRRAPGA